ncbi:MAG: hypothetical protein KGD64_08935 [Candidatus Heimdallarchaeota archaeon]|nr:hypothetical protein [Candidatus Heimdallarchaeota archaeon]
MHGKLNKDWMDDYELSYSKFKPQWDEHYAQVRSFILSSLPLSVSNWGVIGVTSTIPEINLQMLKNVEKLTLLDIYTDGMYRARKFLGKQYNFSSIDIRIFDITHGFVDKVLSECSQFEDEVIEREYLLKILSRVSFPEVEYKGAQYDFITHLGLMDYYLMPVFKTYCERFADVYEEFFTIMRKLNDQALEISLKLLYQLLSTNGRLVISSPVTRLPEGKGCDISLFWVKDFIGHIEEAGFLIIEKSEHMWEEFPLENGHSHKVINVLCEKKKDVI